MHRPAEPANRTVYRQCAAEYSSCAFVVHAKIHWVAGGVICEAKSDAEDGGCDPESSGVKAFKHDYELE